MAQDWYLLVFEVIDLRSFSNLWYWIALAVFWSSASHWVLGCPYDLINRAKREGGEAEADLHDLVRVHVNRLMHIAGTTGLWLVAVGCFGLTALALLGFVYNVEFAQAVFLIVLPMTLLSLLSLHTARRIHADDGADLYRKLTIHRIQTQALGVLSISVTAVWGMLQNIVIGPI